MKTERPLRKSKVLAWLFLLAMLGGACSSSPGPAVPDRDQVLVSAAASLSDAFPEVKRAFEAEYPELEVILNFGGSSSLREQILEGAPADVFAPADPSIMDAVLQAGEVSGMPHILARNVLQIAVPAGNPAGVSGLTDFGRPELLIGLCAEGVPCGDLARQALTKAGVSPALDTDEPDVRALLTKIETGELDAGITYATDVASSDGRVAGIDVPDSDNLIAEYPIAVLLHAPNPRAAQSFLEFVLGAKGQTILAKYGFRAP